MLEKRVLVVTILAVFMLLAGFLLHVFVDPFPLTRRAPQPWNSHTNKPNLKAAGLHTMQHDLQSGNSHLPYISPALENMKKAPKGVFKEPPADYNVKEPPLKIILFWNKFFSEPAFSFGYGRTPFLEAGCPVNTCFTTENRELFPATQADAILWHFRSDKSLPEERSPDTKYVFFLMESPAHLFGDLKPFNGVFNWTFTYRLDSDFPIMYDRVYRRREPLPLPSVPRNYAEGKTKVAAWFVSNCYTAGGREQLVKTLRRWIQVDQFGSCGRKRCPRQKSDECNKMLEKDYKFYLSFENSLCLDYVTEKFFNALRLDVVPVVYGFGNYSALAPPHSYIDALSFPSAKALADYLLYLHHNDTAYNEYFRWKRFHHLGPKWGRTAVPFCELCEWLHSDIPPKSYNLKKWFLDDSHCKTKNNEDIRNFINGVARQ